MTLAEQHACVGRDIERRELIHALCVKTNSATGASANEISCMRAVAETLRGLMTDEKRAANIANRCTVNGSIMVDLTHAMSEMHTGTEGEAAAIAKAIIVAVATGKVRHVRIEY